MTLHEIVEKIKDGEEVEDIKLALLVLDSILSQAMSDANDLYNENNPEKRKLITERLIGHYKRAKATDPKDYLGDNHPGNPKYVRMRTITKEIAKKFMG